MIKVLPALLLVSMGMLGLQAAEVTAPPLKLVDDWKLAPSYTKCAMIEGLPVLGSAKVSDYAIKEAAFLIRQMLGHRPEILHAMASNHVRFVVMAPGEMTTDVPEHSDLQPRLYWNRRARGLGATKERPAVSCGEENLLDLPGDPYQAENILIHEFAHALHEMGLSVVTPDFDDRLKAAYEHAKTKGLWKGTYAMQNRNEYWAEVAQSWFDCNRANDREHGPVDTRDKLKDYDPEAARLCVEVFGDSPWRYAKPSRRSAAENQHLLGFDVSKAGRFVWPKEAPALEEQGELLTWLAKDSIPATSPRGEAKKSAINFVNRRKEPVTLEWLDFDGQRKFYAELRPTFTSLQGTFAGHVWVVSERGKVLGYVVAGDKPGRVEIK